jgi:NAD(P)-dependent dehydrogenase (short-subunit alcohol dehydrogenase family)
MERLITAVAQVKKLTGFSLDSLVNNAGAGYSATAIRLETQRMH